jgi:hypothetical protein
MSDYFNPLDACPMSRELLHHRTVTTIRCGPCGLLNPAFDASPTSPKLPERRRAKPPIDAEVIDVDDSPVPKPIPPPQRRGLATKIPAIPDFKLGYAEKDRQTTKPKSGHTPTAPTVHFSVGVAKYTWNELGDVDEGCWSTASDYWTVTEDNRVLTRRPTKRSRPISAGDSIPRVTRRQAMDIPAGRGGGEGHRSIDIVRRALTTPAGADIG